MVQRRNAIRRPTVVHRYFAAGEEMPVAEFLQRSRAALAAASERVRAKFGYSCSSAFGATGGDRTMD